jgi:hypothetical protein
MGATTTIGFLIDTYQPKGAAGTIEVRVDLVVSAGHSIRVHQRLGASAVNGSARAGRSTSVHLRVPT